MVMGKEEDETGKQPQPQSNFVYTHIHTHSLSSPLLGSSQHHRTAQGNEICSATRQCTAPSLR